jgi:uncharacterized protein YhhL (DUF1145 family)
MSLAKAVVVVSWLLFFSCFFIATSSTVSLVGRSCFWLLAITHAIESVVFLPRLRSAPGSLVGHLARTMLFGVLHVREIRDLTSQQAPHS